MAQHKRVFLVGRHALYREGLKELFAHQEEFCVVGEAENCSEAAEHVLALQPDLVLLDIERPGPECGGIVEQLRQALPDTKFVGLVDPKAEEDLYEALVWGVDGYLSKNISAAYIFKHLRDCMGGEIVVSHILAAEVVREFATSQHHKETAPCDPGLTPREKEILQLVARGYSNKRIAATLCITESTAKRHMHSILDKLHLENRVQAATYALQLQGVGAGPGQHLRLVIRPSEPGSSWAETEAGLQQEAL